MQFSELFRFFLSLAIEQREKPLTLTVAVYDHISQDKIVFYEYSSIHEKYF